MWRRAAFGLFTVAALVVTAWGCWRLFTTRIVIDATAKSGERIFVTQSFMDGDIWYNTRIITLDTEGVWRGYYYDHEDDLWFFSRVTHEENGDVALWRSGEIAARWRPATHELWRVNGQAKGRMDQGMIFTNVPSIIRERVSEREFLPQSR